jgi:hypothetical protein
MVDAGCSFPRIHLLHGSVHKAGCEMYGTNYPQEALWMLSHSLAKIGAGSGIEAYQRVEA